jgi:penicillin-binding protein-related factor A (putative recombinase)
MMPARHVNESRMISALPRPPRHARRMKAEPIAKSFLLLFFKKEESIFFLERKKQRTFAY